MENNIIRTGEEKGYTLPPLDVDSGLECQGSPK